METAEKIEVTETIVAPVKERPILFSGEMVRAILEGRKTQTRRVMKPQPDREIEDEPYWYIGGYRLRHAADGWPQRGNPLHCPYGYVGDRLWVRETWGESGYNRVEYRAFPADGKDFRCVTRWRPSIHMPRKASRITLEITNVRVERLQDISEEDAKAEGMEFHDGHGVGHSGWRWDRSHGYVYPTCRDAFERLWGEINGAESWAANPWVWVIGFSRVGEKST